MTFAENLARAAATATCSWFNTGGNTALSTVLVNGVITTGLNPATVTTGLGLLALSYGCSYDPNNPGPLPPTNEVDVCREAVGGYINVRRLEPGNPTPIDTWTSIVRFSAYRRTGVTSDGKNDLYEIGYTNSAGFTQPGGTFAYPKGTTWQWSLSAGATCKTPAPVPGPTGHLDPVTHHDSTGCDIKVEHLAWNLLPDGRMQPVLKMSPVATARTTGGVIGGCNWEPVIYVGPPAGGPPGGGGGGGIIPWLPPSGAGPNWWIDAIQGVLEGTVEAALEKLFETKFQPDTYRLVSVCETDAQGEPVSQERRVDIPALPAFEAVVARVDALTELIQGLKDFKQPICRTRPQLTGEWVTVNFISDDDSPAGERPLRKVFRYRDQTSASQDDHVAHWQGFSWQAGPVMVVHKGASWGTPKVWAQTPAEGKRVIRHAATIAGVDTEAPGTQWIVSGASDPRYGQSGTMRVSTKGGVFHVSKRPTPDGLPLVPRIFVDS